MPLKKIITYNLNGIRAALSKGLIDWIKVASPDILCVQETKAQPDQIHSRFAQCLPDNKCIVKFFGINYLNVGM